MWQAARRAVTRAHAEEAARVSSFVGKKRRRSAEAAAEAAVDWQARTGEEVVINCCDEDADGELLQLVVALPACVACRTARPPLKRCGGCGVALRCPEHAAGGGLGGGHRCDAFRLQAAVTRLLYAHANRPPPPPLLLLPPSLAHLEPWSPLPQPLGWESLLEARPPPG